MNENWGWLIWIVVIFGAWSFFGDDNDQVRYQSASSYKAIEQNCHPSYSGCLKPNASDYDCAGGSGNGPYYTGKVQVIGPDVFGLDRDKDGWGCE